LDHDNIQAWQAWAVLNQFGRQVGFDVGYIDISKAIDYCRAYELTTDDLDKILLIDRTALPLIKEKQKQESDAKKPAKPARRRK
jgi:hypothetical protein